jgi:hypothetical protein
MAGDRIQTSSHVQNLALDDTDLYHIAKETRCLLIITLNLATRRVFRNDIEEDMQLNVHVGRSGDVDADIFYDYLRLMFILPINNCRQTKEISDVYIHEISLIDNCSDHLRPEPIQLLSDNEVKVIIFPLRISGIYQEYFKYSISCPLACSSRQKGKEAFKE